MKHLTWIIAIVVLFFVGDRIGGYVLKQITEKSQFRYTRLYNGEAGADILLVGNSRGLIFYQPYIEEVTGESTFNLSYNGMPMDLGSVLVQDYLDKYPAPKQMILDITMCDRDNPSLISSYNLYTPYSSRMYDLIHTNDKNSAIAGKLTNLYLYNSELFQRSLFYLNKSDEDWLLDRVINQNMVDGIASFPVDSFKLKDQATYDNIYGALATTVKAAQAKGVDVKLVVSPYYPPFADKVPNMDQFIQRAEDATGLKVHNYATVVKEVKGFGDYQHLNKLGARLYIDQLAKDGILTSK